MSPDTRILDVLVKITEMANDRKRSFADKLNSILQAITECMQVKKSSIMLLKNKKILEVVASTNAAIIGVEQSLAVDSPSSWVVRHKKHLYVDSTCSCDCTIKRFQHYKGDAFFLVPLIDNNRVIGVISITEKIGSDTFNQDERQVLLHIMGHVIIALRNHTLAETLKRKEKTLKKKNLELRKLEKLRTDLFNMLIHDLKGPLSEIVANLDILSYTLEGENLSFVETAQSGCNTLYNMVSNLLDIARLEEGRLQLIYEPIRPRTLIKDSLAGLLVSVKSRDITFNEAYQYDGDVQFSGDRSMLMRVFQNLLTNAIRFSPAGASIEIGCRKKEDRFMHFYVRDCGPGIPEEARDSIFDKYKQVEKRSDGRTYTAGLGLAFCRMAVEAHGGRIGVDIPDDGGSCFYFELPLKKR